MNEPSDAMSVDAWLALFSAELQPGTPLTADDRAALLDIARVAAHRSERIAAPLTTFLLGIAMSGTPAGDWAGRIRDLVERLDRD